jgi:hypothetical protein
LNREELHETRQHRRHRVRVARRLERSEHCWHSLCGIAEIDQIFQFFRRRPLHGAAIHRNDVAELVRVVQCHDGAAILFVQQSLHN